MGRPRTHHDEKKQELIKIAFGLFMSKGYESTSIQDIMNAAKISKGAMYHYFANKEDVLDAVLNHILDLEEQRLAPVFQDASLRPLEKLTATMRLDSSQVTPEAQQATTYAMQRPASIFDYRARELSRKRTASRLADLIREGIAAGEFHTEYPDEMSFVICSASQSIGEQLILHADHAAAQRAIGAFLQLFTHCLGLGQQDQQYLSNFFRDQFGFEANE